MVARSKYSFIILVVSFLLVGATVLGGCAPSAATVSVVPDSGEINHIGATTKFIALAKRKKGVTLDDEPIIWTTSDESIAIVDDVGLVTAVGAGVAVVSASTESGISNEAVVTVQNNLSTEMADMMLRVWLDPRNRSQVSIVSLTKNSESSYTAPLRTGKFRHRNETLGDGKGEAEFQLRDGVWMLTSVRVFPGWSNKGRTWSSIGVSMANVRMEDYFAAIEDGRQEDARSVGSMLLSDPLLNPAIANETAWRILTEVKEEKRDADLALSLAEKAAASTQNNGYAILDTYSYALCLAGRCEEAVTLQTQALELCESSGSGRCDEIVKHLELFKQGRVKKEAADVINI